MGEKDCKFKQYANDNHRFADLFNYCLYRGRQVIDPDKLRPVNIEEIATIKAQFEQTGASPHANKEASNSVSNGGDIKGNQENKVIVDQNISAEADENPEKRETNKVLNRFRDLFKFATVKKDTKQYYIFLGLEEQSANCSYMAVRCMLYNAMTYNSQIEGNLKKQFPEIKQTNSTILIPVITVVVYFGKEKWTAPKSLYEMMPHLPDEIKAFIPNFHINLIDPHTMNKKDFNRFKTSWKAIFEAFRVYIDKEAKEWYQYMRKSENMKNASVEDFDFLEVMTGYKIPLSENKENDMNAQQRLDEYLKMCIEDEKPKIIEDAKPKIIEDAKPKIIEDAKPKIIEDAHIQTARRMFEDNLNIHIIQQYTQLSMEKLLEVQNLIHK